MIYGDDGGAAKSTLRPPKPMICLPKQDFIILMDFFVLSPLSLLYCVHSKRFYQRVTKLQPIRSDVSHIISGSDGISQDILPQIVEPNLIRGRDLLACALK